jgi:carbon-monoxide dehydrogenase medium subunit
MKPAPFDYHAPATVEEATALLATLDNAKVLAGGQSLVAMMNFRYVIVDHLVDLGRVAALRGIGIADGRARIGAMTLQRDLEYSDDVARHLPLLREALSHVGHRQTRNRGTLGGSLSHADPAAELPAVCAAYDAEIELASERGTRRLPFAQFAAGFMSTALEPDEILTAVEVPLWADGHGYGFSEFARRRGDFAIVGVAALVELGPDQTVRRASIALCGAATTPGRHAAAEQALVGRPLRDDAIRAAAAATRDVDAISDIHASPDYRRHLAEVLTQRALRAAAARCGITG